MVPSELGNLVEVGGQPVERRYCLGNLANLERMSLNGNQLSGAIPSELGNLANLERMSLNGNQLSGAIPSELGNLDKLEYLYLGDNQLSGCVPAKLLDVPSNDVASLGLTSC